MYTLAFSKLGPFLVGRRRLLPPTHAWERPHKGRAGGHRGREWAVSSFLFPDFFFFSSWLPASRKPGPLELARPQGANPLSALPEPPPQFRARWRCWAPPPRLCAPAPPTRESGRSFVKEKKVFNVARVNKILKKYIKAQEVWPCARVLHSRTTSHC